MEQTSWKRLLVAKAFLLYLTSSVFKVRVAGTLEDVCATCHVNATCHDKMDGSGGKVCTCMYGFLGNGITQCQDKNECQAGRGKICGDHTVCHNTYGSFYCTCLRGYSPSNNLVIFIPNDGTQCKDIDECKVLFVSDIDECKVQGICGEGGWCTNVQGDFSCRCQAGYKVQNGSQPFHPHRDTAFCKAIDCGQPPSVTYATQLSGTGTRYGSVAKFGCLEGFFQKSGNNTAICGEKGVWEGLSLVCEEINCGPPAVFPNTDLLWDRTAVLGSVVHYACKHGFYLEGGRNHSTCTSAREWERITVTCREINCGPPAVFPNTDLLWDRTAVLGSVVHYACKHGFYLEGGRNHSTCTSAREWERTTVTCREVDCGEPPALPHTERVWSGSGRIGTVVHYQCNTGFYNAGGDGPSVCTANGHWDVASLQCQEVDCGVPMLIPHASVLWNKPSRMGSVAYYICDRGYYSVNGKTRSVCGANGLWEDITMLCEEINCGPPAVFPNTDLLWDRTAVLGSVVHYACKHGFYLEGGRNHSTCTSAREWERITVTCRARCGPPPSLPRWEVAWQNGSSAGSVALHRCQRGYRRWRGRSLSICEDTGMWQPATLVCREIRPAISKLVLFNEKCLRWTAERYDERGEDYTVQIVGSRDYQRAFRDVRKRVFSSESDQPELCLNLQPGTNYTINITALSARFSCTITANTSIHAPPVPEVVFRDVEVPLPSLWLRRSMNTLDPISMYQVFVVPLEGRVAFDCRSASEARFHSDTPAALYLAAQIPVADVGAELSFTVGDQRHYGEYYNAPLQPGRDYYIILRAVSQWGRVRKQSCVFWAKVRGTSYIIQSATMLTGGLIGLVAFVVFLRFAHVWYCKKT
ncbi:sushi domain-containing protein 1 isoform X18 [Anguilla anguilla]|uniref:sushi domain-containing protein 1 isoform X18 n=1 Tax=Anguilla anguilla TaxID=7936 RepID=UPI0015AA9539|nr:sushi domain-containing protein 1 isoform X18 [Anguilla anguilla]